MFYKRTEILQQNDEWHLYMFLAAFYVGCTRYIKPRVYRVFWKYGLQMFDMLRPGLLAGGILCVALNLILRWKFSQNLPTNDSLQKVPVKLQVPENCILPGFFKILPPRRHSLGQRVRKGCGILSFSPLLYSGFTHWKWWFIVDLPS